MGLAYNNCGVFQTPMEGGRLISSSSSEDYPWPNQTTTNLESIQMGTKVVVGDFDNDSYLEAVFVSNNLDDSESLIRIVSSGPFTELFNVDASELAPHPDIQMLLINLDIDDLDPSNDQKELVFVNKTLNRIIAIDLADEPGKIRFDLRVVEPMTLGASYDFAVTKNNQGLGIELGPNRVVFGFNVVPYMQSNAEPIDGGWQEEWSSWLTFSNGMNCSKSCGDGVQIKNRLCNNPEPRNGGLTCPKETVEGVPNVSSVLVKACRLRDCTVDECGPYEIFNNGSCDPDPDNRPDDDDDGGTGCITGEPGCTGGGDDDDDGGVQQPEDCLSSEVYDPFYLRCFKAYPYNDIELTYIERYQFGEDREWAQRERTYKLGLNHPKAIGMSPKETAREYCRWKDKVDVVSWEVGEYRAGTSEDDLHVYVLCNIATNGMYYRGYYSDCPIGNLSVSFGYRNSIHDQGDNVQYLKSVICRKNE